MGFSLLGTVAAQRSGRGKDEEVARLLAVGCKHAYIALLLVAVVGAGLLGRRFPTLGQKTRAESESELKACGLKRRWLCRAIEA